MYNKNPNIRRLEVAREAYYTDTEFNEQFNSDYQNNDSIPEKSDDLALDSDLMTVIANNYTYRTETQRALSKHPKLMDMLDNYLADDTIDYAHRVSSFVNDIYSSGQLVNTLKPEMDKIQSKYVIDKSSALEHKGSLKHLNNRSFNARQKVLDDKYQESFKNKNNIEADYINAVSSTGTILGLNPVVSKISIGIRPNSGVTVPSNVLDIVSPDDVRYKNLSDTQKTISENSMNSYNGVVMDTNSNVYVYPRDLTQFANAKTLEFESFKERMPNYSSDSLDIKTVRVPNLIDDIKPTEAADGITEQIDLFKPSIPKIVVSNKTPVLDNSFEQ